MQASAAPLPDPAAPREVWLIRHAERVDHGDIPSEGLGLPPLSERGHQQAHALAKSFTRPPDLIITSSFVRARQTAGPLRRAFPRVPVEEWPVQEITFLNPERFRGTTIQDRAPESAAYWQRNDPHFLPGPGAESFVAFIARIDAFPQRLHERAESFIAVIPTATPCKPCSGDWNARIAPSMPRPWPITIAFANPSRWATSWSFRSPASVTAPSASPALHGHHPTPPRALRDLR